MAWHATKRCPAGCDVDVRWRYRRPRLNGARGEGQGERQRDRVAEVNWRAQGQSVEAVVGGVRGWRERCIGPPLSRLEDGGAVGDRRGRSRWGCRAHRWRLVWRGGSADYSAH